MLGVRPAANSEPARVLLSLFISRAHILYLFCRYLVPEITYNYVLSGTLNLAKLKLKPCRLISHRYMIGCSLFAMWTAYFVTSLCIFYCHSELFEYNYRRMHCACTKRPYFHFLSKIWRYDRVPRPRFLVRSANFGDSRTFKADIGLLNICMGFQDLLA